MTEEKISIKIEEGVNVIQVDNTPFTAVKDNNEKWHLALGDQIATPLTFHDAKEAIEYVQNLDWDLVFTFVAIMVEKLTKK